MAQGILLSVLLGGALLTGCLPLLGGAGQWRLLGHLGLWVIVLVALLSLTTL